MNNAIFMRIASRRTLHANISEPFPRERRSRLFSRISFDLRDPHPANLQIENGGFKVLISMPNGIFALAIISARRDHVEIKTRYVMRARARAKEEFHSTCILWSCRH